MSDYLKTGGIPEYVKSRAAVILSTLIDDILVKDIGVRHAIRDLASLKQLAVYLISTVGTPVSANRLSGLFGVKSSATLLEYFSYFRDSYLVEFLPQFSYSLKAQNRNPKKVYAIDTGLITAVSTSFSSNDGRMLENLVYIHLRRQYTELFYYTDKGECDFVAFERGKPHGAIQVCYHIDDTNFKREYSGLLAAMKAFNLQYGVIVTYDQQDRFEEGNNIIELIPAYHYLRQTEPGGGMHRSGLPQDW